ncbi:MAG: aminodeoxychorismate synthase component I [Acidimicrobiales bacterium]|nr:aminodeoxychorismate synthase component I [Acidimicrobiales bacterium]
MSLAPTTASRGNPLPSGPFEAVRHHLGCEWTPTEVALALGDEPHAFALVGSWLDSGAVLGSRPALVLDPTSGLDPFTVLDQVETTDAGPGVFGGWVGYLGYQAGRLVERLPGSPPRPHPLPDWWLAWHDHVLRFDPDSGWWFEALVSPSRSPVIERRHDHLRAVLRGNPPPSRPVRCAPFRPTPTGNDHRKAVRRALELIGAGDIYQANVCLRLSSQLLEGDPLDAFAAGSSQLAPRQAAHLDLGGARTVTSLSPEQFLRRRGDQVTTSPIKGTRRRDPSLGATDPARHELTASAKDRAENVMIVDLMRNDLGRVCRPGSIKVPRLLDIEAHPGLWHLVSEVTGHLSEGVGDGALMRATFPPGSVTGAPKVRAMEVIAEVEATGREVYTGAIGMVSPVAGAEWSVAIRTFEHSGDDIWLGVGGGIVAESDPDAELAECISKASPLVEALGGSVDPGRHG